MLGDSRTQINVLDFVVFRNDSLGFSISIDRLTARDGKLAVFISEKSPHHATSHEKILPFVSRNRTKKIYVTLVTSE